MKVTLLQRDIVWGQPQENVVRAQKAIDANPGSDLYVLPEMFSTGFSTTVDGCIELEESKTIEWMKNLASQRGCAIAGSIALNIGKSNVNHFCFAKPDGTVSSYDKRHLFTYGGEPNRFSEGYRRVIVPFRGVRFLLQVCYDLRFPVFSRNRKDYDAVIYVASWPTVRRFAWDTLLRARAIENQCFVLAVNRIGEDPCCKYNGGTALIDPYGATIAACPDSRECELTADLDMSSLESFRQQFPVLDDADDFYITNIHS